MENKKDNVLKVVFLLVGKYMMLFDFILGIVCLVVFEVE